MTRKRKRIPRIDSYVLAHRHSDGDPRDPWAVGFVRAVHSPGAAAARPEYDVEYAVRVDCGGWYYRVCVGAGMPLPPPHTRRFAYVHLLSRQRGAFIVENKALIEELHIPMHRLATAPLAELRRAIAQGATHA